MPAGGFSLYSLNQRRNSQSHQSAYANSTFTGVVSTLDLWEGSSGGTYGWFVAGAGFTTTNSQSQVDRVDFSNDTVAALSAGFLSGLPFSVNANIPYNFWNAKSARLFGGSLVNYYKIDWAVNLATLAPSPIVYAIGSANPAGASIFNNNYGWTVGGGGAPGLQYSYINRLEFGGDAVVTSRSYLPRNITLNGGLSTLNYGWSCGGLQPSAPFTSFSFIQRLDMSNDLVAVSERGPLTFAGYYNKGVGNLNYGYLHGSLGGQNNRIDYSNDTATALARGSFHGGYANNMTGNAAFGWSAGRFSFPNTAYSTVSRTDYSNDTAAVSNRGPLPQIKSHVGAASNHEQSRPKTLEKTAQSIGYFVGGGPAAMSYVDRINFQSDTAIVGRNPLPISITAAGTINSAQDGYVVGGYNGSAVVTSAQKLNFYNDSLTVVSRGPLSQARRSTATSGNVNYAWISGGGVNGPGSAGYVSTVDRFEFANDQSLALIRAPLPVVTSRGAGAGNANYGWMNTPDSPNPAAIYRIDYANDTQSPTTRGTLATQRTGNSALGNDFYGWWVTGFDGSITVRSSIDRIDYSNDSPTTASVRSNLSSTRYYTGAAGSSFFGWFGGGRAPGFIQRTEVDRVDFSNDLVAAVVRTNLPIAKEDLRGTSNYVKAVSPRLFFGGATATGEYGYLSVINSNQTVRLDFSNDSANTTIRGNQTSGSSRSNNISAMANRSFYYVLGGGIPILDRLTIANDTANFVARTPVTTTIENTTYGNDFYGYHVVGFSSSTPRSTIERIDYANDNLAPSVRGFSLNTRPSAVTMANATFGWVGTGWQPNYGTSVDRMSFANDTVNNLSRSPITVPRYAGNTVSSRNYGWIYNGSDSTNPNKSSIERYDFSNDGSTGASVVRSTMPVASNTRGASFASSSFGYFKLISNSTIYRLDLNNDTVAPTSRGTTTIGAGNAGASNYVVGDGDITNPAKYYIGSYSQTSVGLYGSWFGGYTPIGLVSSSERIDFANDTGLAIAGGNLSLARHSLTNFTNSAYGWFAGGQNPSNTNAVDRLDLASRTTAVARSGLLTSRGGANGVSNNLFGWIIGGNGIGVGTTVERIDLSNDGIAPVNRGPIVQNGAYASAAVADVNYGWKAGGYSSVSAIERLTFANDTATASTRGNLTLGRVYLGGVGNRFYGYFVGGGPGGGTDSSLVERLDLSADLLAPLARSPLARSNRGGSATGSATYGYWGGGIVGAVFGSTAIDRIDFTNDTTTPLVRNSFVNAKRLDTAISEYTA